MIQPKFNPPLTILTIVFGLLFFNLFIENNILSYIVLILAGIGVTSPKVSIIIEKVWFKVAFILSQIIPNILLIVIFFFILTPTALLSKIFSTSANLFLKNSGESFFVNSNKSFDKEGFERAW